METKDIRSALERLAVLAERWQSSAQSGAIERDMMLAELRKIYDMVLFSAPHTLPEPQDAAYGEAAVVGVAMVATAEAAEIIAERGDDMELLDIEADFDTEPAADSDAEPESAPEPEAEAEAEPVAAENVTVEPVAVAAAAEPQTAADEPNSRKESEPEAAAPGNLLFGPEHIQQRSHRRMMSLYDDAMFDRLPDAAAPAPVTAPAPEPASTSAPATAPEPESAQAAAPETAQAAAPEPAPVENIVSEPVPDLEPAFDSEPAEKPELPAEEQPVTKVDWLDDDTTWDGSDEELDEEFNEESDDEKSGTDAMDDEPADAPQTAPVFAAAEPQPVPTVLGDVMNSGVEVLGDTMAPQASLGDTLAHAPVKGGLKAALDISERYQIIAELFGGDADACDVALEQLDAAPSLEDAVICIEEDYHWSASSPAAAIVMDLLDRKFS